MNYSDTNPDLREEVLRAVARLQTDVDAKAFKDLTLVADELKTQIQGVETDICVFRRKRAADELRLESVEKRRKGLPTTSPYEPKVAEANKDKNAVNAARDRDRDILCYAFTIAFDGAIRALKVGEYVWYGQPNLQRVPVVGVTFQPGEVSNGNSAIAIQVGEKIESFSLFDALVEPEERAWHQPIWPEAVAPWSGSETRQIYSTLYSINNTDTLVFCASTDPYVVIPKCNIVSDHE